MSIPTPLQSFLGGATLSVPVYNLLTLNGSVFGISGFLHRTFKGGPAWSESAAGVAGLVIGGAVVGVLEGSGPEKVLGSLGRVVVSGLLVGLGTKLANGCTSGHMICGVSRFSPRSLVATATFFTTGVLTNGLLNARSLAPARSPDWTLGSSGNALLFLQSIPFAVATLLRIFLQLASPADADSPAKKPKGLLRLVASLSTAVHFALALRLSNLTDPLKVLSFLALPFSSAFDPSLACLAVGALPLSILLYNYARGEEKAKLGGPWGIPKGGDIDGKLLLGAALFGVGWGIEGICPGPGLVNIGRALAGGAGLEKIAAWVGAVVFGGILVPY